MDLKDSFIEKAKKSPARIVYPEGGDERIVSAAAEAKRMGIAEPIVIQKPDPEAVERYAEVYAEMRGMRTAVARKLVAKPLAFGGMMVKMGDADGMIAGVASATSSVIQAASLTIGFQEGMSTPSSFFIMVIREYMGETDKPIIFADCAVNISPDARQLAEIAVASGTNAKALLGIEPYIAFLSFSTKGTAAHADVDKVVEAVGIARGMAPQFEIDGEFQADAAINPDVAKKKVKESSVAGRANVLIFPDLDAGNMCYKLVQQLGGAAALGPILQGFARPVNDMSRGASVDDLIGVTAITSIQVGSSA